jgi:hypothetical protein
MKFEPGKYYKTRDGRKARIYITDAGGTYSIHGAVWTTDIWVQHTWQADGGFNYEKPGGSSLDLVAEWEEPKPREILYEWVWKTNSGWRTSDTLSSEAAATGIYSGLTHRKTGRAFYADDGSPVPQDVLDEMEGGE